MSYSHLDEVFRDELAKWLKPLERDGIITLWSDQKIAAGNEWDKEIIKELNKCELILLLISQNFLASDYINEVELVKALERHEKKEAMVVPIIIKKCNWKDERRLAKLKGLPKDGLPILSWPKEEDAYFDIIEGIKYSLSVIIKYQNNLTKR